MKLFCDLHLWSNSIASTHTITLFYIDVSCCFSFFSFEGFLFSSKREMQLNVVCLVFIFNLQYSQRAGCKTTRGEINAKEACRGWEGLDGRARKRKRSTLHIAHGDFAQYKTGRLAVTKSNCIVVDGKHFSYAFALALALPPHVRVLKTFKLDYVGNVYSTTWKCSLLLLLCDEMTVAVCFMYLEIVLCACVCGCVHVYVYTRRTRTHKSSLGILI